MNNIPIKWVISKKNNPKSERTYLSHVWPFDELPKKEEEVSITMLSTIIEHQKDKNRYYRRTSFYNSNEKVIVESKVFNYENLYFKDKNYKDTSGYVIIVTCTVCDRTMGLDRPKDKI